MLGRYQPLPHGCVGRPYLSLYIDGAVVALLFLASTPPVPGGCGLSVLGNRMWWMPHLDSYCALAQIYWLSGWCYFVRLLARPLRLCVLRSVSALHSTVLLHGGIVPVVFVCGGGRVLVICFSSGWLPWSPTFRGLVFCANVLQRSPSGQA